MNSILVTGGTGTFAHAYVRRMMAAPASARLCLYSRGEMRQAEMAEEFHHDARLRFFVGDVRDRDRLARAMEGCEYVVHAAALKRIEVGAYNPDEMVKTNVGGAINVIEAARTAQVTSVVAISSDKAWQPISPYGQSKALAESLFLAANSMFGRGPRYSVVRYGNVWCSNGSVVPLWKRLVAAGAPTVPVTDPDCTRFFMTAEEAVDLVQSTFVTMPEVAVIPDWLRAYRLGDLAEALGARMQVIGLPSWEKKHEGMRDGVTSDVARRMSVEELRAALRSV